MVAARLAAPKVGVSRQTGCRGSRSFFTCSFLLFFPSSSSSSSSGSLERTRSRRETMGTREKPRWNVGRGRESNGVFQIEKKETKKIEKAIA